MCVTNNHKPAPVILDAHNACLWRGTQPFPLPPKTGAVLQYLVEHPRQLVTKNEWLDAAWPDPFVSDTVLRNTIRSLRQLLQDNAKAPRFIETVPRQGYRLIGSITTRLDDTSASPLTARPQWIVGRDEALRHMQQWPIAMDQYDRRVGLILGEVGIGKTTLIDTFLAWTGIQPQPVMLRGQGVEHDGIGEAFLPVFEALHKQTTYQHFHEGFETRDLQVAKTLLAHFQSSPKPHSTSHLS